MISIVTTCKGRLAHLKQTLPSWLSQYYAGDWEIVIVDHGCPDLTYEWVRQLNNPRVRSVKASRVGDDFSINHARNVGALHARGDVLAFVDADCFIDPNYIREGAALLTTETHHVLALNPGGSVFGCCFVRRSDLIAQRGFDESLIGWGREDTEAYARWLARGGNREFLPAGLVIPIDHGDDDRVRFYSIKSTWDSSEGNRVRTEDALRIVNQDGFGEIGDHVSSLWEIDTRYGWPLGRPTLPANGHGWFRVENRNGLRAIIDEINPKLIVEVGTWLGLSARYMLDLCPRADLIAIDLWSHHAIKRESLAAAGIHGDKHLLYDHFIATNWLYKNRLHIIRNDSATGLREIANIGLRPDLIYLDASHDRHSFDGDLRAAAMFPGAILCGDDWGWTDATGYTIRPAVTALADARAQSVITDGEFWAIR